MCSTCCWSTSSCAAYAWWTSSGSWTRTTAKSWPRRSSWRASKRLASPWRSASSGNLSRSWTPTTTAPSTTARWSPSRATTCSISTTRRSRRTTRTSSRTSRPSNSSWSASARTLDAPPPSPLDPGVCVLAVGHSAPLSTATAAGRHREGHLMLNPQKGREKGVLSWSGVCAPLSSFSGFLVSWLALNLLPAARTSATSVAADSFLTFLFKWDNYPSVLEKDVELAFFPSWNPDLRRDVRKHWHAAYLPPDPPPSLRTSTGPR